MVLTDVRLQNYRSYLDSSFELSPGTNIVVGPNARGKTNLIEALLLVSNNTAYRDKNHLIRGSGEWARIDVHTNKNDTRTLKLSRIDGKIKKQFEINKKEHIRLPFGERNPIVLFEPNNLFLLNAEPSARREYFDSVIAQIKDNYSTTLSNYSRSLAQRNALLKSHQPDTGQLFVWNLRLCEWAEKLVIERNKLILDFSNKISDTYSQIAGRKYKLRIRYISKTNQTSNYSADLLKDLEGSTEEDKRRGFTSFGPHRDDIHVYLGKTRVHEQASRGEIRTSILALKIIQLELLEKATSKKPLFLLDDVFSELDGVRRKTLTDHLKNHQAVLTTTDADIIHKNFSQKSNIIPL